LFKRGYCLFIENTPFTKDNKRGQSFHQKR
jgi:hypothetical protein